MKYLVTIIRFIFTGILIYLIYTETGMWTALFAALVCLSLEAIGYALAVMKRSQ